VWPGGGHRGRGHEEGRPARRGGRCRAGVARRAAAVAARQLDTMWETRLRMLGDDVVELGTDLNATADQYARNEATAEANIAHIDPRYRRYE
jgi:hypothetical protein